MWVANDLFKMSFCIRGTVSKFVEYSYTGRNGNIFTMDAIE